MEIDPQSMTIPDRYHLLIGLVTPRPIAWVTTRSPAGVVNLAPFSFFNVFGANPPTVVFSPALRRDGTKKDTLRNLESHPEFVIHLVTPELAEKANMSSREIPPEESEVDLTGVTTAASVKVSVPRVIDSPVQMECRVRQIVPCGTGPLAPNLIIGEVVYLHLAEGILDEHGRVDPHKLVTVARLGGEYWARTTDLFKLTRQIS